MFEGISRDPPWRPGLLPSCRTCYLQGRVWWPFEILRLSSHERGPVTYWLVSYAYVRAEGSQTSFRFDW